MKTYKTWEVIKMLGEDSSLKFKCLNGLSLDYKEISVIDGVVSWVKKYPLYVIIGNSADQWQLVQQPVTFMEAAVAFSNGKDIRCEYLDFTDKKIFRTQIYKQGEDIGSMLDTDDLTFYLAINGKWYIEEEI